MLTPGNLKNRYPKWRHNLKPEIYFLNHHVWYDPQHLFFFFPKSGISHQSSFERSYPTIDSTSRRNPRSCSPYQPSATERLSIIGGAFNVSGKDQQQCCHVHWCHIDGLGTYDNNATFLSPVFLKEGKMTCSLNIYMNPKSSQGFFICKALQKKRHMETQGSYYQPKHCIIRWNRKFAIYILHCLKFHPPGNNGPFDLMIAETGENTSGTLSSQKIHTLDCRLPALTFVVIESEDESNRFEQIVSHWAWDTFNPYTGNKTSLKFDICRL